MKFSCVTLDQRIYFNMKGAIFKQIFLSFLFGLILTYPMGILFGFFFSWSPDKCVIRRGMFDFFPNWWTGVLAGGMIAMFLCSISIYQIAYGKKLTGLSFSLKSLIIIIPNLLILLFTYLFYKSVFYSFFCVFSEIFGNLIPFVILFVPLLLISLFVVKKIKGK